MRLVRATVMLVTVVLVLVACGADDTATVEQAGGTSTTNGVATTAAAGPDQPAIWPAGDVVFATPEEAASDFVTQVLGVPPQLGEFQAGDSRSGEIEVLCCTEGGGTPSVRSVLLLRQLGPGDGWFVIGAVSDVQTITAPESMAEVDGRAGDGLGHWPWLRSNGARRGVRRRQPRGARPTDRTRRLDSHSRALLGEPRPLRCRARMTWSWCWFAVTSASKPTQATSAPSRS